MSTPQDPFGLQPQPSSLRHLIVNNKSNCLWCEPDLWTPELLELLQCEVHLDDSGPGSLLKPPGQRGSIWRANKTDYAEQKQDAYITDLFRDLILEIQDKIEPELKIRYSSYASLHLYYGGKPVTEVGVRQLIQEKDNNRNLCGYIDTSWMTTLPGWHYFIRRLAKHRRQCSVVRPCIACSIVEYSIDPYFVATMIAMAQNPPLDEGESRPGITTVQLFAPTDGRDALDWYRAEISADFLSKFDKPYTYFNAPLVITHKIVPLSIEEVSKLLDDPSWLAKVKTGVEMEKDLDNRDKAEECEQGESKDQDHRNIGELIAKIMGPIETI